MIIVLNSEIPITLRVHILNITHAPKKRWRTLFATVAALSTIAATLSIAPGTANAAELVQEVGERAQTLGVVSTDDGAATVLEGHANEHVVLRIDDSRISTLPEGPAHQWLGAAGSRGWTTARSVDSQPALSLQFLLDPTITQGVGRASDRAVTVSLDGTVAPTGGSYAMYRSGTSGDALASGPRSDADEFKAGTGTTASGEPQDLSDSFSVPTGAETPQRLGDLVHRFTAPGMYCVSYTFSFHLGEGAEQTTAHRVLKFAVGDEVEGTAECGTAAATPAPEPEEEEEPTKPDETPTSPETPGDDDHAPEPDAVWDVANGTVNEAGAIVLNNGHVDIASLMAGGRLDTQVKDTTKSSDPTWHDPAKTVLQLLPESRTTVPSGSQWSFLGTAGSPLHQVSQTAQAGLLWPGWSTESIAADATKTGVDWTLTDVSGPGEFSLYETGSFGQPTVLFSTHNGITVADAFTIPKLTHAHGSWAFTAQGNYCLAFDRATALASGKNVSDSFVLAIAVGTADVMRVDPAACFQKPSDEPTPDNAPTPDDELTDATRGGVKVLDGVAGFRPGQLVTVRLPEGYAGQYVSGWVHSTPAWLGWESVDSQNAVSVRLPTKLAAGEHRIVLKTEDGSLIGWDTIRITRATTPERPREDPESDNAPPSKTLAATQCVAGATILSAGHVDYASRILDGKLESLIGDDSSGTKVYREPSGTILWLKPSSRVILPAGYGSVGSAGSRVWQVPQTQNTDLIWLGWNTEALNAGNTRGPVSWKINSVNGPGSMKVYLSGAFGGVQQMVFSGGGSYQIPQGVHAHANWAFSAEGIYRINMTQTANLANGRTSSDTETLTIVVGNVDPTSATGSGSGCATVSSALLLEDEADKTLESADQAVADAALAVQSMQARQAPDGDEGITNPLTALAQGDPVPLLLSILGLLLFIGAAGSGALWWRSRRRGASV